MTKDAMRVAVAEVMGWKLTTYHIAQTGLTFEGWADPTGAYTEEGPPDYPNDLNAMHEAEERLFENGWLYEINLRKVCDQKDGKMVHIWKATALQRCEAFLRTLGKWRDE